MRHAMCCGRKDEQVTAPVLKEFTTVNAGPRVTQATAGTVVGATRSEARLLGVRFLLSFLAASLWASNLNTPYSLAFNICKEGLILVASASLGWCEDLRRRSPCVILSSHVVCSVREWGSCKFTGDLPLALQ